MGWRRGQASATEPMVDVSASQGPTPQESSQQGDSHHVLSAAIQSAVYATGLVDHSLTAMLVDTGSAVTLVHSRLWLKSGNREMSDLEPSTEKIVAANGQPLRILGSAVLRIRIAGIDKEHKVLITDDVSQNCFIRC